MVKTILKAECLEKRNGAGIIWGICLIESALESCPAFFKSTVAVLYCLVPDFKCFLPLLISGSHLGGIRKSDCWVLWFRPAEMALPARILMVSLRGCSQHAWLW